MAFVKFEVEKAPSADVRLGKLGITFTKSALERHHLGDAEYVNLYFDPDTNEIGISASAAGDRSAFKTAPRGKTGRDIFIASKKFYERFGIVVEGRNATDGKLVDRDGIAAFTVRPSRAAAPPKPPYTGKPRGRRKKEVAAPEEQAA